MIEYFAKSVKKQYWMTIGTFCIAAIFYGIWSMLGDSMLCSIVVLSSIVVGIIMGAIAVIMLVGALLCIGTGKFYRVRRLTLRQINNSVFKDSEVKHAAKLGEPVRYYKILFFKRYVEEVCK